MSAVTNDYIHFDEGDKSTNKKFGCALVVGVERAPLKVTKAMSQKKVARRSRVKPFVKVINYSHLMPTRYNFELEVSTPVSSELLKDPSKKKEIRGELKKVMEDKYKTGQSKWFFQKLRF
jgi:large subunit ribosomal protein L27e